MKAVLKVSILILFLLRCSNSKQNLIVIENDYEINLTDLDAVKENLNGFWIPKNDIAGEKILWLNFEQNKNSCTWDLIPFTKEIKQTKAIPYSSCPTFMEIFKQNGNIQVAFIGLGSSDTTTIEYLSKTKFKIDGVSYLRHKGYDFLK